MFNDSHTISMLTGGAWNGEVQTEKHINKRYWNMVGAGGFIYVSYHTEMIRRPQRK